MCGKHRSESTRPTRAYALEVISFVKTALTDKFSFHAGNGNAEIKPPSPNKPCTYRCGLFIYPFGFNADLQLDICLLLLCFIFSMHQ